MRWAEALLFLLPFLLYGAWRVAAATARPGIVWGATGMVLILATATIWLGLSRRLDRGETYVPARIEDGRIVPGHGKNG